MLEATRCLLSSAIEIVSWQGCIYGSGSCVEWRYDMQFLLSIMPESVRQFHGVSNLRVSDRGINVVAH
eukprot:scaffold279720_cov17-Prasinocladus_malaysianus.AAC.1